MSAYNRINGIYASENKPLLMDLLKKQWGFDGLVISDWYGTYSGKIFEGGCDLEMPGPARWMGENPSKLKDICKYDQDLLNEKVRRLLRTIFRTNAFHTVFKKEESVDRPEHRKLIRKIGCEAIVLLKNERNLLPLNSSKFQKIAVIGQLASRISFQGGGSSQVAPHYVISPLEALENRFKRKI